MQPLAFLECEPTQIHEQELWQRVALVEWKATQVHE